MTFINTHESTPFKRKLFVIDIQEKECMNSEVEEGIDSTEFPETEENCNVDEASTSQNDEESSGKRKRKSKHFNKPLTQKVSWQRKDHSEGVLYIKFLICLVYYL